MQINVSLVISVTTVAKLINLDDDQIPKIFLAVTARRRRRGETHGTVPFRSPV